MVTVDGPVERRLSVPVIMHPSRATGEWTKARPRLKKEAKALKAEADGRKGESDRGEWTRGPETERGRRLGLRIDLSPGSSRR